MHFRKGCQSGANLIVHALQTKSSGTPHLPTDSALAFSQFSVEEEFGKVAEIDFLISGSCMLLVPRSLDSVGRTCSALHIEYMILVFLVCLQSKFVILRKANQ